MELMQQTDARWRRLAEEVLSGIKEWRLAHPRATLAQIEMALDERWARARAVMLQDLSMASAAADMAAGEGVDCPGCGQRMRARGRDTRRLTTVYEQDIELERSYAVCPSCGEGLFPPG